MGGASYLFGDQITVVTLSKKASGKLGSATFERGSVCRTDRS